MGFKKTKDTFTPQVDSLQDYFDRSIIEALEFALFEIQSQAKNKVNAAVDKKYIDRTNKLNSSIGWVLYKDGEFISSNFQKENTGKEADDGDQGVMNGLNYANQEAKKFPKGYVAVLVAGADYAVYVESKGYDVLTGSAGNFDEYFREKIELFSKALKTMK